MDKEMYTVNNTLVDRLLAKFWISSITVVLVFLFIRNNDSVLFLGSSSLVLELHAHNSVTETEVTKPKIIPGLLIAGLFKYVWPFSGHHQALKG